MQNVYNFWKSKQLSDGSFPEIIDGTGTVIPASSVSPTDDGLGEKTLIQQTRHLYFLSEYARHAQSEDAYNLAKMAFNYIKTKQASAGEFPYSLSKSGGDTRVHLYALYTAIYGISVFGLAASDRNNTEDQNNALQTANKVLERIDLLFLYPKGSTSPIGYMAPTAESPEGLPNTEAINPKHSRAYMSFNAIMHGIEALTQMYILSQKSKSIGNVGNRLQMLMNLIVDKMIPSNEARILDLYDPTVTNFTSQPRSDLINYGHNLETVFLMDMAVKALGVTDGSKYMNKMKAIGIDMLGENGKAWDTANKCANETNMNESRDKKSWWSQFEVMVAAEWMYQNTSPETSVYRDRVYNLVDFIKKFYKNFGTSGEFVSNLTRTTGSDWSSTQADAWIGHNWKSSYHVGRSLIFMSKWLNASGGAAPLSPQPTGTQPTGAQPTDCSFKKIEKSTNAADYAKYTVFTSNSRLNKSISPVAFLTPNDTQELSNMIKCANNQKITWRVRGGGHSYEALSLIKDGWVIDLRNMNRVTVNTDNTAFVGGGQLFGNVYKILEANGVYIPAGTGPNVGVSGLTLGGGVGFATRKHGPTCNSVVSATVVLADGSILQHATVNDTGANNDLIKALRGGGPFYAVVAEWKFKTYPVVNMSRHMYTLKGGPSELLQRFNNLKPWEKGAKYTLIEFMHSRWGGGSENVEFIVHEDATQGSTFETDFGTMYNGGTKNDTWNFVDKPWKDYITNITNLGNDQNWNWNSLDLSNLQKMNENDGQGPGGYSASSVVFGSAMTPAQITALTSAIGQSSNCFYQIRCFNTKLTNPNNSSWPYHAAFMECQIYAKGDDDAHTWVKTLVNSLKNNANNIAGHLYNYINSGLTTFNDYFPGQTHLPSIKSKYDPQGIIMKGTPGYPATS